MSHALFISFTNNSDMYSYGIQELTIAAQEKQDNKRSQATMDLGRTHAASSLKKKLALEFEVN
jgi:hypothetical protein